VLVFRHHFVDRQIHVLSIGRIDEEFDAADSNGRAYASVLRLSSVTSLCVVAKRCFLEQKLLLTAYRKSYMKN